MLLNYQNFRKLDEDNKAGPVYQYYPGGQVKSVRWIKHGELHHKDKPALITYYQSGQVGSRRWYVNGLKHRVDGPAIIDYYPDGAVDTQIWYKTGRLNREDGPAYLRYDPHGEVVDTGWFLEGGRFDKLEFWKRTPLSPERIKELLASGQLDYDEQAALSKNPNFEDEQDEWLLGGW